MINESIILIVGMLTGVVISFIFLRIRKVKIPRIIPILQLPTIVSPWYGKPTEMEVDKSISDKTKWICDQGVKMLSGWKEMPNINIKFCRPETMPNDGQVSGVFYFETPDTIYINGNIIDQSWLVAKIALHELYHLYQVNIFGTTNDTDTTVNRWSDEVMDRILFSDYYKETGINKRTTMEFRCPGKFTQIRNEKFVGTIWSEK